MAHFLASDDNYRDLIHDDDYRSYRVTRGDSPGGYRFGRASGKRFRVHARNVLRGVNGYLRGMIWAIADAKLRRMERELELRGIRFHRSDAAITRSSQPAERTH